MKTASKMLASEICEDAITSLDERGWCQGEIQDVEGRVCMIGALRVAADLEEHVYNFPAFMEAKQAVRDKLPIHPDQRIPHWNDEVARIPHWNDEVAKDKTEVQRVLMEAAKTLRNEGR